MQLGNDVSGAALDLVADDVKVVQRPPSPPIRRRPTPTPPDTTIDAGPSGTARRGTGGRSRSRAPRPDRRSPAARRQARGRRACRRSRCGARQRLAHVRASERPTPPATPTSRPRRGPGPSRSPAGPAIRALPPPTNDDPGTVAVADGFEQGLGQWTQVNQRGRRARPRPGPDVGQARTCALELDRDDELCPRARRLKVLPAGTNQVWADGWFEHPQGGRARAGTRRRSAFPVGKRCWTCRGRTATGTCSSASRTPPAAGATAIPSRKLDAEPLVRRQGPRRSPTATSAPSRCGSTAPASTRAARSRSARRGSTSRSSAPSTRTRRASSRRTTSSSSRCRRRDVRSLQPTASRAPPSRLVGGAHGRRRHRHGPERDRRARAVRGEDDGVGDRGLLRLRPQDAVGVHPT